jgi:hypothetical protein
MLERTKSILYWINCGFRKVVTLLKSIDGLVTAIATVAIAIVASLQWETLEKTDETMRASQRAYVYFDKIVPSVTDEPNNQKIWTFIANWGNSGNATTKNLTFISACLPSALAIDEPFPQFDFRNPQHKKVPQVIGPRTTSGGGKCDFPSTAIDEVKAGQRHVYLGGEAKYLDGVNLKKWRITRYSFEMIVLINGAFMFQTVGINNCADDDCPEY